MPFAKAVVMGSHWSLLINFKVFFGMQLRIVSLICSGMLVAEICPAQCILGLDANYCANQAPDTLQALHPGGYFDGEGISSDGILFPESLSPGLHAVTYYNTTYYIVDTTGVYAPKSGTPNYVSLMDDGFSDGIDIGFDLSYFGATRNYVRIHSNGFISFNFAPAIFPPYANDIPTPGMPTDFIASAWADYDPTTGGTISWYTGGTTPYRYFCVQYTDLPPYGETEYVYSAQIVLYETTNIIEIHTSSSPDAGDRKSQGIENVDGTIGFVRPGRNNSFWETANDYVAFIPEICVDSFSVSSPPLISTTEPFVTICVPYDAWLYVEGAETYTWLSDTICTASAGPEPGTLLLHAVAEARVYTCYVSGTDILGCSDTTSVQIEIIDCPDNITQWNHDNALFYPNPAREWIQFTAACHEILIFNACGAPVMQKTNLTADNTLNIAALPPGFYSVVVRMQDGSSRRATCIKI